MGVLPHKDVMKNLTKADLGIECSFPTPNYLYSESNKIFEYMSVGLPVLCSNLPRIKEIVEGSKCGICVNPLDTQAIANSIEYLMNNPNLRKELGENGRKAILEKYNWEKEKLLEAYNKVLE
jgi:glycosyltransferase involved in cell wall biosynthesis